MKRFAAALIAAGIALVAFATYGYATPPVGGEHKVTICHRTNSVTNPYVEIDVDYSGADGSFVHDQGNGDHTNHTGPVFDADNPPPPPHNGDQWGDIIPPFSWPGDDTHPGGSYPGLNWTAEGQAIHANGCEVPGGPTPTPTPTVTPTPTETPTVVPTPTPTETFGEGGGSCPADDPCRNAPKKLAKTGAPAELLMFLGGIGFIFTGLGLATRGRKQLA